MRADARRNREQIVAAARELVARDGDEIRIDEVAARAGVAHGTLYRHFPTKGDLVDAIVGEATAEIAALAEAARRRTEEEGSALAALRGFFVSIGAGHGTRAAARRVGALLGLRAGAAPVNDAAHDAASRAVDALMTVTTRAQQCGEMRPDVGVADLFLFLAHAPESDEHGERSRYLALVADLFRA